MTKIEIKHRWTGAVLFTHETDEADPLRAAVLAAIRSRADLSGADLSGADLSGANLSRADLSGAYLSRADLSGADLSRADLSDADLSGAYLSDADLSGAYLSGAYLSDANLSRADLSGAYLSRADLSGAYLSDARNVPAGIASSKGKRAKKPAPWTPLPKDPAARAKRYAARASAFRKNNPTIPVVKNIDVKILAAIESGKGALEMGSWHSCETTHCRAGWATTLAGKKGAELERERGPFHAGVAIYLASTGRAPHFFATNDAALADIKECAAQQKARG